MLEGYIELFLTSIMNFHALDLSTYGSMFSALLSSFFLIIFGLMPVGIYNFIHRINLLRGSDPIVERKYGEIFASLR
jgi:hypothetical protein